MQLGPQNNIPAKWKRFLVYGNKPFVKGQAARAIFITDGINRAKANRQDAVPVVCGFADRSALLDGVGMNCVFAELDLFIERGLVFSLQALELVQLVSRHDVGVLKMHRARARLGVAWPINALEDGGRFDERLQEIPRFVMNRQIIDEG